MGPIGRRYGKPLKVAVKEAGPYLRHVDKSEWILVLGVPVAILGAALLPASWWGIVICMAAYVFLALLVVLAAAEERQRRRKLAADMRDLLQSTPTGAPRIVEVPCRHGDMHRYHYLSGGQWELIGPAVQEA